MSQTVETVELLNQQAVSRLFGLQGYLWGETSPLSDAPVCLENCVMGTENDKCHFLQPYVWHGRWHAGKAEGSHLARSKWQLVLKCILSVSGFLCVCDG